MNESKFKLEIRWLNRNFELARQIKVLKDRRDSEVFANISNYDLEGFSGTSGNTTEDKMVNFAELNRKIEQCEERLFVGDMRTKQIIDNVRTPVHWAILRDRYIDRLKWEEIAKSYHYSVRNVQIIHGKALREVQPFIPEEAYEDQR